MYRLFTNTHLKLFNSLYLILMFGLLISLWLFYYAADHTTPLYSLDMAQQLATQTPVNLGANLSFAVIGQVQAQWLGLFNHNAELLQAFSRQDLRIIQYLLLTLSISYWPATLLALFTNKQHKTRQLRHLLVLNTLLYLLFIDWLLFNIMGKAFLWSGSFFTVAALIYQTHYRNRLISKAKPQTELMIAYATQSGKAAQLAKNFAQNLPIACHIVDLAETTAKDLLSCRHTLFIVSTYGDGEPPESARRFFSQLKKSHKSLQHLSYSILALGDNCYPHFCAFGHALDTELQRLDSHCFSPLQEVNREQPQSINHWWQQVTKQLDVQAEITQQPWLTARVLDNQLLNPETPERPAHHLKLKLKPARYFAGDLLEVLAEGTDTPRTYSIASASHTGSVDLLVRKVIKDNGEPGLASGYLSQIKPGQKLKVAFREHPNFHLPDKDVPLILIAAGTGLAPFIAFLQQRARDKSSSDCWLFMGERYPQQDNYFCEQLDVFQQQGTLTKRFHAWSRNGDKSSYIAEILQQQAEAIRQLVLAQQAHIYICGNAKGFGTSVQDSLERIFDSHWSQDAVQHKIKKDLY